MAKKNRRKSTKPTAAEAAAGNTSADPGAPPPELPDGITLLRTLAFEKDARSLSWSPVGRTLAVGFAGGLVQLWDTETGAGGREVNAIDWAACALAWAADGRRLAVGGDCETDRRARRGTVGGRRVGVAERDRIGTEF